MKTAISFLKLVGFLLLVGWMCSCGNNNRHILDQVHAYEDSIGINQVRINMIQYGVDSIEQVYMDQYPPVFFADTVAMYVRKEWQARERAAYHEMITAKREYEARNIFKKIWLEAQVTYYKSVVDSLKLELE